MRNSHRVVPVGFMLSVVLLLLLTASPSWAELKCGDTIYPGQKVTLNKDLNCFGENPALRLIGPKAVLNLGGYTVDCQDPGNATGIKMEVREAILKNGTVTNCRNAVSLDDLGHHLVTKVTATNGNSGFRVRSNENDLSYNTSKNNTRGYFLPAGGNRNTLKANLAENNNDFGFFIAINTDSDILSKNRAIGTHNVAGFQIAGNGHTVRGNLAKHNEGIGFLFFGGDMEVLWNTATGNSGDGFQFNSISESDYTVKLNTAFKNGGDGIRLKDSAEDSTILGNVALRNKGTDLVDENIPPCDNNSWKFNFFRSRNQPCIR